MKQYAVIALGGLLIDFTENGLSEQGNPVFEANQRGAPCNMLAMLTKLGHSTAFIGKVGDDYLGNMLCKKVSGLGIDTTNLQRDKEIHTTLAFVHTFPDGDRDFSFYRNPGADMMLTKAANMGMAANALTKYLNVKSSRLFWKAFRKAGMLSTQKREFFSSLWFQPS